MERHLRFEYRPSRPSIQFQSLLLIGEFTGVGEFSRNLPKEATFDHDSLPSLS